MKKLLFISLLTFSIDVVAVNWVKIEDNTGGDSFYVDVDDIKKSNGHIYYWNLINFIKPSKNGTYSHISEYKVNCKDGKQTWLSNTFYDQFMAKGKKITQRIPVWNHYGSTLNEVRSLTPDSIEDKIMKFACANAK